MINSFVEECKKMSDDEIIESISLGDYEYLQSLIDRYMPLIISLAKSLSNSEFDTDDLIAEGVLAVFFAVKDFDSGKSKFSTFVSLCIKRAMLGVIKSSKRLKRIPENMISSIEDVDIKNEETPEEIVINKENYESLKRNITSELSELELKVLSLFLEGESYIKISEKLGISLKSVDNSLSRIRTKLKK